MSDCPKVNSKSPNIKKPPLAHGWEPFISSSHPDRVYYWNRFTGNAVWEIPEVKPSSDSNSTVTSSPSSSLSSKSSNSKRSEADSSKKATSNRMAKSPEEFTPGSPLKRTKKLAERAENGVEDRIIKRPIKIHNNTDNIMNKQSESPITAKTFGIKRKLCQSLNAEGVLLKTDKTGKSPLLRRDILPPSATFLKVPKSKDSKKSSDYFSDNDPISDMEVEMMVSDDESKLSDVEMEDISKELFNSFIKSKEEHVSNALHIVIDTNILLHNLNLVSSLKDKYLEDCGNPIIVIPWMVLTELNQIKDNKNKTKSDSICVAARKAIRFLNTLWKNKHPRIKGQIDTQDKADFDANQPSLNWDEADDRILYCCLQLGKRIGEEKVCLLSDDKNLMNRMMCVGLKCCNSDGILEFLKVNYNKGIVLEKSELTMEDKMDETMKTAFKTLTGCLTPFFLEKAIEAFGVSWESFLYRKPPWVSLLEILENYSKHWNSVFSCIVPITAKSHLEKMKEIYRESKGYIYRTQESCRFLDAAIYFLTDCDNCFNNFCTPIQQLKQIKQDVCDLCAMGEVRASQTQIKNMRSSFTTLKSRFENSAMISERDKRVLENLHYLWLRIFTQYTCLILDSLNYEHEISYNKPEVLPPKSAAIDFLPKFFPLIRVVRTSLGRILFPSKDANDKDMEGHLKMLHKQFAIIPSTLNIDVYLPFPFMDLNDLEAFCLNSDYREVLIDAFYHFNDLFAKLQECIRTVSFDDI